MLLSRLNNHYVIGGNANFFLSNSHFPTSFQEIKYLLTVVMLVSRCYGMRRKSCAVECLEFGFGITNGNNAVYGQSSVDGFFRQIIDMDKFHGFLLTKISIFLLQYHMYTCDSQGSSPVEQCLHKALVVGPTPTPGTHICNHVLIVF